MIGELIPTGVTFGNGRQNINNSFSGNAEFNNITLDSGGDFYGGNGGGVIYSGGTNLYDIFSHNNFWISSSGNSSVILNNSTENYSQSIFSLITGSGNTMDSLVGNYGSIIGGVSNKMTFLGGSMIQENSNSIIGGSYNEIIQSFASARRLSIIGGIYNEIGGFDSSIIGGSGNTSYSNYSVILGGQNLTSTKNNTAMAQRIHVDEYIDLEPQNTLPEALKGRMFFSGNPLNRMMYCTGITSEDWVIL